MRYRAHEGFRVSNNDSLKSCEVIFLFFGKCKTRLASSSTTGWVDQSDSKFNLGSPKEEPPM